MKIDLFINNQDIATDQYTEIKDPGRLKDVVGLVAKGSAQHVDQAVQAAYQAFLSWRRTPLEERLALLQKAADQLEALIPSLALTISKENGMLLNTTKAEIGIAVLGIRNLTELAREALQPSTFEDATGWVGVEKRPIGVIAAIVPWNAPSILTMQKLVPAVAAGNTLVFKPSPFAPMGVTVALRQIAALFPPGVINVIHGEGDVGSALTTHPLVRKISFTGGGPTAKFIMKAAADTLKSIHFELGGNDPAIVLDDADLDEVVPKIANAVFRRSGQYCYAIKRVYVPQTLYEPFYNRMCGIVDEYKIGHQLNEQATFGPLNNRNAYENIKKLVERTKNSSAKLVELGTKLEPDAWEEGYYIRPAIVRDAEPDQEIVSCEQFGPVIPLVAYHKEEDAIRMANDTEYGLGSSVWSADVDRAKKVAREIEAGMTYINNNGQTALGYKMMPFGGVKQSGIGRENSPLVYDEYIEYHAINVHKNR